MMVPESTIWIIAAGVWAVFASISGVAYSLTDGLVQEWFLLSVVWGFFVVFVCLFAAAVLGASRVNVVDGPTDKQPESVGENER